MHAFQSYYCEACDQFLLSLHGSSEAKALEAAGFQRLEAHDKDESNEKHVPVVKREGGCLEVSVGSVLHPMTEAHSIYFVAVVQGSRVQIQKLTPADQPVASFSIEEGPASVYEFCNLHGLWMAEV